MLKLNRFPEDAQGGTSAAEPVIDFDALSAPEGATKDQIDLLRDKPQPAAPAAAPKPAEPPAGGAAAPAAGAKTAEQLAAEKTAADMAARYTGKDFHSAIFSKLQEYTGVEASEIPNDVTDENFVEKLSDFIIKNTEFDGEGLETSQLHPTVRRLQELIDKKIPVEEAFKQVSAVNMLNVMPAKDLMTNYLKQTFGKSEQNPNGWDDAKVASNIDRMEKSGVLEMEAEKLRNSLRQADEEEATQKATKASADEAAAIKTKNEELSKKRLTLQKEISKSILNYENILGVPVSKADMQEYLGDFLYLTTPEDDGITPGQKLLQSNDNYAKALYMLLKGDTKIKEAITTAKNKTKIDFISKLDLEPQLSTKVTEKTTVGVDLDLMDKPDGFIQQPKL